MSSDRRANIRPAEVLTPILGTHLVSVFHGHLRILAENLEKKRRQPPKTLLAAAKVIHQRQVSGSEHKILVELDHLEHWLGDGSWLDPPFDTPPLLSLIEETVHDLGARGDYAITSVNELLNNYRTMIDWSEAFLLQRPNDQAGRDEVVLFTVARLNILSTSEPAQEPIQSESILTRPYERLPEGWAADTAVGVRTYSKGHFGNDQDAFNDVCRAFVVDLLHRALQASSPKTIYLSTSIFDESTGWIRAELDQKIIDCLAAGWRIIHVLNRGAESSSVRARVQADFATHMLAHMQTEGTYVPVPSVRPDSTDMALVDGIGAVLFPSVGFSSSFNRAAGPPSPALAVRCITGRGRDGPAATPIVAELRAEARTIFADLAEVEDAYLDRRALPFGYRIPTEDLLWFDRQLAASELLEGERYALKAVVTTSTMPDHLSVAQFENWRQELQRLAVGDPNLDGLARGWSEPVMEQAMDYINERGFDEIVAALRRLRHKRMVRHFSLETNTMSYRYRDCVLKSHMDRYLTDEGLWYWTNPVYGPGGLALEHRHEHGLYLAQQLESTRVNLELGSRSGYHLGLIGESMSQPYDISRMWWLATESRDHRADQVHYFYQPRPSSTTYVATLKADSVAHFDAVQTFVSLFDAVWYTLDLKDSSPASVIDYLLDHLPTSVRREFVRIDQAGLSR